MPATLRDLKHELNKHWKIRGWTALKYCDDFDDGDDICVMNDFNTGEGIPWVLFASGIDDDSKSTAAQNIFNRLVGAGGGSGYGGGGGAGGDGGGGGYGGGGGGRKRPFSCLTYSKADVVATSLQCAQTLDDAWVAVLNPKARATEQHYLPYLMFGKGPGTVRDCDRLVREYIDGTPAIWLMQRKLIGEIETWIDSAVKSAAGRWLLLGCKGMGKTFALASYVRKMEKASVDSKKRNYIYIPSCNHMEMEDLYAAFSRVHGVDKDKLFRTETSMQFYNLLTEMATTLQSEGLPLVIILDQLNELANAADKRKAQVIIDGIVRTPDLPNCTIIVGVSSAGTIANAAYAKLNRRETRFTPSTVLHNYTVFTLKERSDYFRHYTITVPANISDITLVPWFSALYVQTPVDPMERIQQEISTHLGDKLKGEHADTNKRVYQAAVFREAVDPRDLCTADLNLVQTIPVCDMDLVLLRYRCEYLTAYMQLEYLRGKFTVPGVSAEQKVIKGDLGPLAQGDAVEMQVSLAICENASCSAGFDVALYQPKFVTLALHSTATAKVSKVQSKKDGEQRITYSNLKSFPFSKDVYKLESQIEHGAYLPHRSERGLDLLALTEKCIDMFQCTVSLLHPTTMFYPSERDCNKAAPESPLYKLHKKFPSRSLRFIWVQPHCPKNLDMWKFLIRETDLQDIHKNWSDKLEEEEEEEEEEQYTPDSQLTRNEEGLSEDERGEIQGKEYKMRLRTVGDYSQLANQPSGKPVEHNLFGSSRLISLQDLLTWSTPPGKTQPKLHEQRLEAAMKYCTPICYFLPFQELEKYLPVLGTHKKSISKAYRLPHHHYRLQRSPVTHFVQVDEKLLWKVVTVSANSFVVMQRHKPEHVVTILDDLRVDALQELASSLGISEDPRCKLVPAPSSPDLLHTTYPSAAT